MRKEALIVVITSAVEGFEVWDSCLSIVCVIPMNGNREDNCYSRRLKFRILSETGIYSNKSLGI